MYSLHNKFHVDFVLLVWISKHTFKDLRDVRRSYPKNAMAAHLNINSLRYKFDEIKEVLTDNIVDLLIISENTVCTVPTFR
jgi:hypothetical protein